MTTPEKITTNLWFTSEAGEAADFYTAIFPDSRIGRIARYTEAGRETHHMPPGSVMTVEFWLAGRAFVGLNGGPIFKFNEAVSLIINCETQAEIDHYWTKLGEGGDPSAQVCGWLKDKYGLSWQVVPTILPGLITSPLTENASRAMNAMLKMKKLNIAELQAAFDGK